MTYDKFAKGHEDVYKGSNERDSDEDWGNEDTDTAANDGDLEDPTRPSRAEQADLLLGFGLRSKRRDKRDKMPAKRNARARNDDDEQETIEEMISVVQTPPTSRQPSRQG